MINASMIVALDLYAQSNDTLRRSHYGIELSRFITDSEFATGTEMYIIGYTRLKEKLTLWRIFLL